MLFHLNIGYSLYMFHPAGQDFYLIKGISYPPIGYPLGQAGQLPGRMFYLASEVLLIPLQASFPMGPDFIGPGLALSWAGPDPLCQAQL